MRELPAEIVPRAALRSDLELLLSAADEAAAERDTELAVNIVAQIYRVLDRNYEP